MGPGDAVQGAGLKPAPANPPVITPDELHEAYVFSRLRRIGIGYVQAIESPDILAALRGTALARKAKQKELFGEVV